MSLFCSTIIPTIGRPTLAAAVLSVLQQEFAVAEFEVIVVNDTGRSLPVMDWQSSERVRVVTTQHTERSVARNTGAALARGKYLHFLDDDDRLLPGALQSFWEQHQGSDAVWLHGGYEVVDDGGHLIAKHCAVFGRDAFALVLAGELVPFGASMVQAAAFWTAGAFDPTFAIVEDFDLARRLAFLGNPAGVPAMVAQVRRSGGERSSSGRDGFARMEHRSREKILSYPGVLGRLRESAGSNSYLFGRVSRVYLASTLSNLKNRNALVAVSRCGAFLVLAHRQAFSAEYWRGLRRA